VLAVLVALTLPHQVRHKMVEILFCLLLAVVQLLATLLQMVAVLVVNQMAQEEVVALVGVAVRQHLHQDCLVFLDKAMLAGLVLEVVAVVVAVQEQLD